jgi:uncharacterized cupin superfamily protein
MVEEAPLEHTENGLVPTNNGWFVVNAREAAWWERPGRGACCWFEGFSDAVDFAQVGVNLCVLAPGEPMAMYHLEHDQEDFLVLSGEALLIAEGEERPLRRWDLAHCPADTEHVVVGAGSGPCVILSVGARTRSREPEWGRYTVNEAAIRHGAGVEEETTEPDLAYARFGEGAPARCRDGVLP